jgi:hypothetical protein
VQPRHAGPSATTSGNTACSMHGRSLSSKPCCLAARCTADYESEHMHVSSPQMHELHSRTAPVCHVHSRRIPSNGQLLQEAYK